MNLQRLRTCLIVCLVLSATASTRAAEPTSSVKFACHRLGSFRSEACAVGDFNGDGKLDVLAGPHLYLAPDWKPLTVRELAGKVDDQGKGYVDDFANLALDVDGDGRLDVVSCGWFSQSVLWFKNTLGTDGLWPTGGAEKNGNFECADLVDIDGDGKELEILPHCQRTVWCERGVLASGQRGLVTHVISETPMNFGGGVGDVNGDGRPDVLRPDAWFAAPTAPRIGTWTAHPWALGGKDGKVEHTPQILVYDVNADGRNDVVTSSAHQYGVFWYEQTGDAAAPQWKQHVIDDGWTQPHSLALADLDADGDLDLITGKRFMAHNGSDPGEFEPLGVYWYELARGATPGWTKHVISYNEGIGSGMNICVADLDADQDLDLVVTGKWGGPVWFENQRK